MTEQYRDLPRGFETQLATLIRCEFHTRMSKWTMEDIEDAVCHVALRIGERCVVKGCPVCLGDMYPDRGELACSKCGHKLDLSKMVEGVTC